MATTPSPQTSRKTAVQIAGTMSLGGALALLTIEGLEVGFGYMADAQFGVALGVIWNAILGRLARYLT